MAKKDIIQGKQIILSGIRKEKEFVRKILMERLQKSDFELIKVFYNNQYVLDVRVRVDKE